MSYSEFSIQRYFLLLLLFLLLLMGLGTIVPGYLKIREFELQEARSYILDRSLRMREQIEQRIQILTKAGVSNIPSYVVESKGDILREFEVMKQDPRVVRLVLDARGVQIFDGSGDVPLQIQSSFFNSIIHSEEVFLRYETLDQEWLMTLQRQDEWGWYILTMMSEREIYLDSKKYLFYVAGVSALVLLLVLILSILLTRHLRQRAGSMLGLLKRYGDGHYEERLQVTGPAELGELQVGINSMIDNIEMEILSRKSIEEELNGARLQAEGINLAKAEYARDMNYQVQNAMNSARGYSGLLLKSNLDVKQEKYVNNVVAANQLLSSLVSDMLALSDIEIANESEDFEGGKELESIREHLGELDILLVGVDPLNCAYLTQIMGGNGVTLFAVDDETAAIQYLGEEDADLIVLDVDHSKLGGEGAITYIRENMTPYVGSIPILVMSSKADSQTMARYRRMTLTYSLRKPFNATKLLDLMNGIFQAQQCDTD